MVSPEWQLAAALLLAALSVVLAWRAYRQDREHARLARQLQALSRAPSATGRVSPQLLRPRGEPHARWIDRVVHRTPLLRDLDRLLEQAGVSWGRAAVVRAGLGSCLVLALTAAALTDAPLVALAGGVAGLLLPRFYLLRRKAIRLRAFEEQLPDAIDLLSRAIRAGHAVTTGLRTVAEESRDPIAAEFRRVFEEQKYGLPFEDSLLALTRRIDQIDLRVMVVAILVQREVGGNLTEILDKISGLIRTRFTLRRQLRVHSAQGRLSGYVLTLLPVAVGAMIATFDPGYVGMLFTDPSGRVVLGSALALQTLGFFWIWRILKLDI